MNQQALKIDGNDNLIIFFAGWSSHPNQFTNLNFAGHDMVVVYDYCDLNYQIIDCSHYKRTTIIAWSFGVWAAQTVWHLLPQNSLKIAINGTPNPIDDTEGIPIKIFDLTLSSIEKSGIDKFNERMCLDQITDFIKSDRSFQSQIEELRQIGKEVKVQNTIVKNWDYAIIGSRDKIFPQKNMLNYWDKKSNFAPIILNIPHYPFTLECREKLTELINFDR
ncbi:MAG: DUF452 family protein [Rikenellaceae bacterium]